MDDRVAVEGGKEDYNEWALQVTEEEDGINDQKCILVAQKFHAVRLPPASARR